MKRLGSLAVSVVSAIILLGILLPAPVAFAANGTSVQVSINSNQSLEIIVPPATNLTLLAVHGSEYSVSSANAPRQNELSFDPLTNGTYSVLVNVSSSGPSNAMIMQSSGILETLVKNVSSSGDLLLNLTVFVTPAVSSGSNWNALSGFIGLGLNFGGVNLDTTDVLVIFLGLALAVIGLGAKFNQKFIFVGLFLLSIVGIAAIGILGVGLVAGCYVLSFFAVRSYYHMNEKRQTGQL